MCDDCNLLNIGIDKNIDIDVSRMEHVFAKYAGQAGCAIAVLQAAQEIYGYIDINLISYIAKRIEVKPAKLLGVATFYTQFRLSPVGDNVILLCQGTACHVNGSKLIAAALSDELGISEGETTSDGLFTYNNVACLGCCSLSPVMMINDETYGSLTPQKARDIIRSIKNEKKNKKDAINTDKGNGVTA